ISPPTAPQPKPRTETRVPVRPKTRISIAVPPFAGRGEHTRGRIVARGAGHAFAFVSSALGGASSRSRQPLPVIASAQAMGCRRPRATLCVIGRFSSRRPQAVYAFDTVGQLVLLPALAAVLGAEHLALACGAVDPVRIGRALRDHHQRALHRHAVVEALPGLAQVTAAIERALVAHPGDPEACA